MSRLRVAPIVEGDGEEICVRILLQRVWGMLGGASIQVVHPIRHPKGRLVQKDWLQKAVGLAARGLQEPPASEAPGLILVLIDADEDCPADWGPRLLGFAVEAAFGLDVACVLANVEYETRFAAAAESLGQYLNLPAGFVGPETPEARKHGKAWVERHFRVTKSRKSYSPTRDQPGMTRAMDLALCRGRSPSFDKLCRELERRLRPAPASGQ